MTVASVYHQGQHQCVLRNDVRMRDTVCAYASTSWMVRMRAGVRWPPSASQYD